MESLGYVFPFNLFDKRWSYTSIVSNAQRSDSSSNVKGVVVSPAAENVTAEREAAVKSGGDGGSTGEISDSHSYVPGAAEMRRVFEQFDQNKDGVICIHELGRFMKRLGFEMSQEEVKSLVKTVDVNSDGSVDFDEFYSLYSSLTGSEEKDGSGSSQKNDLEEHDDNLREAFLVFDKDQDGFISVKELQAVLTSLDMPEGKSVKKCAQMIESVDADRNGQVDFQEFKKMMTSSIFQTKS